MADARTTRQIEANMLDLDIFNLVRRIERFAEDNAFQMEKHCFLQVARELSSQRFHVQKYMHKADRQALKGGSE